MGFVLAQGSPVKIENMNQSMECYTQFAVESMECSEVVENQMLTDNDVLDNLHKAPGPVKYPCQEASSSPKQLRPDSIKPLEPYDLLFDTDKSYLIRGGCISDRVYREDLDGKPLLIVGVVLPISDDVECSLKDLERTYSAICKEHNKGVVEFVLAVVSPDDVKADDVGKADFYKLLSGFPPFLAIPFDDRDFRVQSYLALECFRCPDSSLFGIVVDKDHNFEHFYASRFANFGSDCYPFTSEKFTILEEGWQEDMWKLQGREARDMSLQSLLCCDDLDLDLGLTKPDGTPVPNTISRLGENVVGLYLCSGGGLMERLYEVYQTCKSDPDPDSEKSNFTIVLLYQPFTTNEDFGLFRHRIDQKLISLGVSDWLLLPFENHHRASRKLWRFHLCFCGDRLFMVGPKNKYVDPDGAAIVSTMSASAFPFTKRRTFDNIMHVINLIREDHFFPETKLYNVKGEEINCERLDDKRIVLLHLKDNLLKGPKLDFKDHINDDGLFTWLMEAKEEDPENTEVIVVCLGVQPESRFESFHPDLPWLVAQCNEDDAASVRQLLTNVGGFSTPTVVAFLNGWIISLCAQKYIGSSDNIAKRPVLKEVRDGLNARYEDMYSLLIGKF